MTGFLNIGGENIIKIYFLLAGIEGYIEKPALDGKRLSSGVEKLKRRQRICHAVHTEIGESQSQAHLASTRRKRPGRVAVSHPRVLHRKYTKVNLKSDVIGMRNNTMSVDLINWGRNHNNLSQLC